MMAETHITGPIVARYSAFYRDLVELCENHKVGLLDWQISVCIGVSFSCGLEAEPSDKRISPEFYNALQNLLDAHFIRLDHFQCSNMPTRHSRSEIRGSLKPIPATAGSPADPEKI